MTLPALRSHLVTGKVRHRRAGDVAYALEHDVYYLALDLDELDLVDASLWTVARNGRGLLEFRDADHWPEPATDLPEVVRDHLRREGEDSSGWRITLITNARVLGYVFNPASFYLCRDAAGVLRVVVVEVHNTHLERHLYTLRPRAAGDRFTASMEKAFYVSPFLDMEGQYTVHVQDEPTRLRIAINERRAGSPVLSTSLVLERRRLTDRNVLRLFLGNPLVTHKTMALIHWHALRLWRRGVPFRRHGAVALPGGAPRRDVVARPDAPTTAGAAAR
jgi:DUF1365 family protein